MQTKLIAQGGTSNATLSRALREVVAVSEFDRLDVAVAYATRQGIIALEKALGGLPGVTRWVVGLDDAITQPEAVEYLMSLDGAELRLASLAPKHRFHPKIYRLWSSTNSLCVAVAIGSGNMTLNGLRHNGEAAVVLMADSQADAEAIESLWNSMWSLGQAATEAGIAIYRAKYIAARKERKKIAALGVAPPEPEPDAAAYDESTFTGEPITATVAWTEGASPSAGGRDLEFPKAMMPFFALGQSPVTKCFRTVGGQRFQLTFTERTDNQMWRLLFSRDSIMAAIGRESLRPVQGGTRSDLAIIFRRAEGQADFDIRMVVIGSPDHEQLMAESRAVDGLKRTRDPGGRYFGFF